MRTLLADEIAQIPRVPKGRIYELVRQGKLPAVRIGRQVRFREETVAAWLDEFENGIHRLVAVDLKETVGR